MKRFPVLIALAVVLAVAGLVLSQQAFSDNEDAAGVIDSEVTALPYIEVTPIPAGDGQGEGTIIVGSPMPQPEEEPTVVYPTSTPLPPAPTSNAALASGVLVAEYIFTDEAALEGWAFDQFFADPAGTPEWSVDSAEGVLVSPDNSSSIFAVNDTLALAPDTLDDSAAIEVDTILNATTKTGLVLGYLDNENYVTAIFGNADAPGRVGITLLQMAGGEPTILAQDMSITLDTSAWYQARFEVSGTQVVAQIDGTQTLSAQLGTPLTGAQAGLYAGSDGFALFDNVQLFDN